MLLKTFLKVLLITGTLCGLVCFLVLVGLHRKAERRKERIREADHAVILAEARALMEKPAISQGVASDAWLWSVNRTDPQFGRLIPPGLMSLDPAYVAVSTQEVMLCLSPLPRVYLLAFASYAEQYGGEMVYDGLWLSSNPATDRRRLKHEAQ